MSEAALPARPVRTWLRWALYCLAAIAAVTVLRNKIPTATDLAAAASHVQPGWLLAAALAECASLGMFARQQRRLLRAFGVRMSLSYAMALTLSRSAIAISLPAGSAISAGFAFQQFRAKGASRTVAGAVMVLSGIMSFAGLAVLYLVGGAVSGIVSVCVLVGTTLLTTVAIVVLWRRWRPSPTGRIGQLVEAAHEIAPRHWVLALVLAIVNWFADLVCLLAVIRAFDLTLPVTAVAGTYLAVQVVRQVPLTPGGIGVIETGLLTGLVGAGASSASAAAAVLGYRVLSCWLIIPVGLFAWTLLRRPKATDSPAAANHDLIPARTNPVQTNPVQTSPARRIPLSHGPVMRDGGRCSVVISRRGRADRPKSARPRARPR